jgi:hypothetical protein
LRLFILLKNKNREKYFMQYKTQGVVLFTSQYSDTFSIAHVFTRDFGRMAYLLPKSSVKKSKVKASHFFPLSVLNMEVEHLPLREIQRLKEVEREFPLYEICTDEVKISISFFCIDRAEVTLHGLRYPLNKAILANWWQGTLNESLGDAFTIETWGRTIVFCGHHPASTSFPAPSL